jgi:hypothetical protein
MSETSMPGGSEERRAAIRSLRAAMSEAHFRGEMEDLGNPNVGFALSQIAEWVVDSPWLAQHRAALRKGHSA